MVFSQDATSLKWIFPKHVLQLKDRMLTSPKPLLFFMIFYMKKVWAQRKHQSNF